MTFPEPTVNGTCQPDHLEPTGSPYHISQLHFTGEPMPARDALFVRLMVSGSNGEALYDEVIRADNESGLETATQQLVEVTGIEAGDLEVKIADIIAQARPKASPAASKQPSGRTDAIAGILDLPTFLSQQDKEEWLVNGMIVVGEPGLLGGPKKVLKTTVSIDLAISLGSGTPFLGPFPCQTRSEH